jgi:PAS domain S-box-containing protein
MKQEARRPIGNRQVANPATSVLGDAIQRGDTMESADAQENCERGLRGKEQIMKNVLNATDVMLVLLDPQFNFLWVNASYAKRCGMSAEEMVGKNHFALYPHTENEAIFQSVRDTGKGVFYKDKPFVFPGQEDQGVTYWDWSLTPCKDPRGLVESLVFSLRETTAFKRAEDALQRESRVVSGINRIFRQALRAENPERLGEVCLAAAEEITESQISFIGELNVDTGLLDGVAISNPGWDACQMRTASGMRRPPVSFTVHGIYGRVILDGKGFFTNDPGSHPDQIGLPPGHPPLTSFLGVPLKRYDHTFGMIAVGNRVKGYNQEHLKILESLAPAIAEAFDRQRAELSLRESEHRYRELVQNANSAIIRWKRDGTIVFFNEYAQKLFGYTADEAIGQHAGMLLPERDSSGAATSDLVQNIVRYPDRYASNVNQNVRSDGSRVWMIWTNRPVFDEQGEVSEILTVGSDITARKQIEQELTKLNETLELQVAERTAVAERRARDLRRLAAQLSEAEHRERQRLAKLLHDDLQQLLVGARLHLPICSRSLDKETQQHIAKIDDLLQECLVSCRNLTRELSPPILHRGSLAELLEWLSEWFHDKCDLLVTTNVRSGLPRLPEHLRIFLFQALRELLFNVVKHSGRLEATVNVFHRNGELTVQVADRGVNFDAEALIARLQRPEGFGLFNIQERLAALGGRLKIQRTPQGGAVFQLVMPFAEIRESPSNAATEAQEKALHHIRMPSITRTNIRLLIVDDHQVVREAFAKAFDGHQNVEVVGQGSDGQQALEMASLLQPDVILMDVDMPNMDGIEATRYIRNAFAGIGIVGLSVHGESNVERAMLNAGADAFLCKETDGNKVLDTIHQVYLQRCVKN